MVAANGSGKVTERLARIEELVKGQASDINELRSYLMTTLSELRTIIEGQRVTINQREVSNAQQAVQYSQIYQDVADLKGWRKEVDKLLPAMRVVIWIGGVLGVSMLALIWALLTGQAQVIFP